MPGCRAIPIEVSSNIVQMWQEGGISGASALSSPKPQCTLTLQDGVKHPSACGSEQDFKDGGIVDFSQ